MKRPKASCQQVRRHSRVGVQGRVSTPRTAHSPCVPASPLPPPSRAACTDGEEITPLFDCRRTHARIWGLRRIRLSLFWLYFEPYNSLCSEYWHTGKAKQRRSYCILYTHCAGGFALSVTQQLGETEREGRAAFRSLTLPFLASQGTRTSSFSWVE